MDKKKQRIYKDLDINGPSEKEFTQAMEVLSDEERDIFENTGVIHIDRDMPAETQALHVVKLTQKHERRRTFVYRFIQVLLIAGIVLTIIGISLQRLLRDTGVISNVENNQTTTSVSISVNEENFPDVLFRSYILSNYDEDGDGLLSSVEIDNVLLMILPEDTSLTSLQGIAYFPNLQSLTLQNTGVRELDVSQNEHLQYLNVNGTQITFLDLSHNLDFTTLSMDNTSMETVVFASNTQVNSISLQNTTIECDKNNAGNYVSCQ